MNDPQRLWWEQAKSDHTAFVCLRRAGVHECHMLHYLQMATEKTGKAYLWRSAKPPPKSHGGFMGFLRALLSRKDLKRIAKVFDFSRPRDMVAWVTKVAPLAHDLEKLAPDLANDRPNPEYPWPHANPKHCPALHSFQVWTRLEHHPQGRNLLKFIDRVISRFDQYA